MFVWENTKIFALDFINYLVSFVVGNSKVLTFYFATKFWISFFNIIMSCTSWYKWWNGKSNVLKNTEIRKDDHNKMRSQFFLLKWLLLIAVGYLFYNIYEFYLLKGQRSLCALERIFLSSRDHRGKPNAHL